MKGLSIVFALLGGLAHADSAPPLPQISCYCTDTGGDRVELGQTACLQVGQRLFTARCEMSLNVPIWREKSEGCAMSSINRPTLRSQSDAPPPHG